MRTKMVAANWKMNLNLQEGIEMAKELNQALSAKAPNCKVVLATPFIHLAKLSEIVTPNLIHIAAENCADKEAGAYTGEVSAAMIASTGATHVIIGHSERRSYYHEDSAMLKEKVKLALANGLSPIFCVGESLEQRESEKHFELVESQIREALFDLPASEFAKITLAYEPVWAIGTGLTATSDQAEEMHAYIRKVLADKYGSEIAEGCSILYGGSCNAKNAAELFAQKNVDGGLIGGASLKVETFLPIVEAF